MWQRVRYLLNPALCSYTDSYRGIPSHGATSSATASDPRYSMPLLTFKETSMIQNASIPEISAYLTTAGIPHEVHSGLVDDEALGASLSFRPKDADSNQLLEWNDDHGWTLVSQIEPSPVSVVALAVKEPATAFHVASAVIAVYAGAVDEFRTISYGDIRYV